MTARAASAAVVLLAALPGCERPRQTPPPPAAIDPDEPEAPLTGEAARGQELYRGRILAGLPPCRACHEVEAEAVRIGPSLHGIADRAAERVPGLGAREYLVQSIVDPDAYVVEGFSSELMPEAYGEQLSPEDIDALVAYLLTRRAGQQAKKAP